MLLPFFQSSMLGLGPPPPPPPVLIMQRSRCMAGRRRVFKQSVSNSSFSSTFSFSCMVERRRAFKQSVSNSSFSSIFSFLLFCFLSMISLVWLPGRIFNEFIVVTWAFMFCVTTDAYWCILIRLGYRRTFASNFLIFHSFYVCRLGLQSFLGWILRSLY